MARWRGTPLCGKDDGDNSTDEDGKGNRRRSYKDIFFIGGSPLGTRVGGGGTVGVSSVWSGGGAPLAMVEFGTDALEEEAGGERGPTRQFSTTRLKDANVVVDEGKRGGGAGAAGGVGVMRGGAKAVVVRW